MAVEQLHAVQREVLRLQSEVESVTDRLWLTRRSVVWSGAAADAWRATMGELLGDSSRGARALGGLHALVREVLDGIEPGRSG